MKFGKTCDDRFRALAPGAPAFPYKQLKKRLKRIRAAADEGDHEREGLERDEFFSSLESHSRSIDRHWTRASKRCVFVARRLPLCSVGLLNWGSTRQRAEVLAEWAALLREAIRKILKKYRKNASSPPPAHLTAFNSSFARGGLRTQIEALARRGAEEKKNGGGGGDGHDDDSVTCPVCFEVLYKPVSAFDPKD